MARKVFMSFLGTNNYVECYYRIHGKLSHRVRFVQEALIADICKDWTNDDAIYIYCTPDAQKVNWEDNGQSKIYEDIEKIGLERRLQELKESMGLAPTIESVEIKEGFNETEIWDIFNVVYNTLQENDEIHFDMTHAFRSIPLFSIVLFNYAKFIKHILLSSVMYGAFEKLGPAYKVRGIPLEERKVDVIDLNNVVRLQEYNQVASGLRTFGRVGELSGLVNNNDIESNNVIKDFSEAISELDHNINTISLQKLKKGKYIYKFKSSYKNIRKQQALPKPIQKICDALDEDIKDFVEQDDYANIEAAIQWTIKFKMHMQTFSLTAEYIKLVGAERFDDLLRECLNKKRKGLSNKDKREFIGALLGMEDKDFDNPTSWTGNLAKNMEVAKRIADKPFIRELRPLYKPIVSIRNNIAHGNGIDSDKLEDGNNAVAKCIEKLNEINSKNTR